MPKASLHCHLVGSVKAETVADLAWTRGVTTEGGRDASNLFDHDSYGELDEFHRDLDVVGSDIRTPDDFHRVPYESLAEGGATRDVVYRERVKPLPSCPACQGWVSPPVHSKSVRGAS